MKMKIRFAVLLSVLTLFLVACGSAVPTKEIEDAKTALERAKQVEAPIYAANSFKQADQDYNAANTFVKQKKNKEAQEKALTSKEKADQAYEQALKKRAETIYANIRNLLQQAKDNDAEKINPDRLKASEDAFVPVKEALDAKDYETVYNKRGTIESDLKELVKQCKDEKEKAHSTIARAQDKYDEALNIDVVREYAKGKLDGSAKLLDEARKAFDAVELDTAIEKANAAEAEIQSVVDQANKDYQAYLADQRKQKELLEVERQKQIEQEQNKAKEYLDRAQEMLKKIKGKNQSFVPFALPHYSTTYRALSFHLSQELSIIADKADEAKMEKARSSNITHAGVSAPSAPSKEETVTEEIVNHYYDLAKESYDKGEYLDSMDYSREAIRLAEILLAQKKNKTYVVIENPKNRDCLWKISGKMYNKQYWMWPIIWKANKYQIKDPDLIYPGQEFQIPPALVK